MVCVCVFFGRMFETEIINIGLLAIQGLLVSKMLCDSLLGRVINNCVHRGRDNRRSEGFHDGSIRESKRSFLQRNGRQ
jgi:hypothetical protein